MSGETYPVAAFLAWLRDNGHGELEARKRGCRGLHDAPSVSLARAEQWADAFEVEVEEIWAEPEEPIKQMCDICGDFFPAERGLAVHKYRAHHITGSSRSAASRARHHGTVAEAMALLERRRTIIIDDLKAVEERRDILISEKNKLDTAIAALAGVA